MFVRFVVVVALLIFPAYGMADSGTLSSAQADGVEMAAALEAPQDTSFILEADVEVSDPLEPINRVMFAFNDVFYSVLMKPLAQVYSMVAPEVVRRAVKNFFHNLSMPKHVLNALLQGKVGLAGRELSRFVINTVVGGVGFFDAADQLFSMKSGDEDTGQTLGAYGLGDGIYLDLPIFGPSNVRDSVGLVGDALLNPFSYVPDDYWARTGIEGYRKVNDTSLRVGEYEDLKKAAIDPYVALRDAYQQMRRKAVQE